MNPVSLAAEIQKFVDRGVDDLILDLRLRMADYEESLEWIAAEALPLVNFTAARRAAATASD